MFNAMRNFLYSLKSEKAKRRDMEKGFASVDETPPSPIPRKGWNERPTGTMVILILCGLVVAYLAYRFGWTK